MFARKAALAIVVLSTAVVPTSRAEDAGPDADVSAYEPALATRAPAPPAYATALPGEGPVLAAGLLVGSGPLHLAWLDPTDAAGRSSAGARDEVARVLRALGIPAVWRRAPPGEPARDGEIRVILLDRGAASLRNASVLGSTPTHFECSPFVWIHVPGVRGVLGLRPDAVAELRDSHALGIALGRVIAHEVLHALVPSVPHGEGLMKSRLTRADLTTSRVPVTPELVALVRAALAAGPAPARPDTGLLAAEHVRDEQQR